jgi:hypothetical protein
MFVACFSEAADSLSQWRAYGSAYAIGFDPESLLSMRDMTSEYTHAGSPAAMPFFDSVKYVSEADHNVLDGILNSAIWNLHAITTTAMYGVINAVAPFIKDAAFESDKEWRLCCRTPVFDEPVMFRGARSHIVPYIQVPIEL